MKFGHVTKIQVFHIVISAIYNKILSKVCSIPDGVKLIVNHLCLFHTQVKKQLSY